MSELVRESKIRDFVCRDQGKLKGCGKIFQDQVEFNEHVKRRNLARDLICPNKDTKPPVEITISDEDDDEVIFLEPPSLAPLPSAKLATARSKPSIPITTSTRSPRPSGPPSRNNNPLPDISQSLSQPQEISVESVKLNSQENIQSPSSHHPDISQSPSQRHDETDESVELDSHYPVQSLSSQAKGSTVSISRKKKLTDSSRPQSETKERKLTKNQQENEHMSLLLDKKVVRKQQIKFLKQKKSKENRTEKDPRVATSRSVSESNQEVNKSKEDDDVHNLQDSEEDDETFYDRLQLEVASIVGKIGDEENNKDPPTAESSEEVDQEEDNVDDTGVGDLHVAERREEKRLDGEGFNQDLEHLETEETEPDRENEGDSSDEEEEEEFVLIYGEDPCSLCPRCSTELGSRDLSINLRTGDMTVYCDNILCPARIVVRNLGLDRKINNVSRGL